MLTSFRRNHSDDQEFAQKLQQITVDLKSSLQQANIYKEREKQPTKDKFSRTLEKIENIINDSSLHMAIRSALIRKELRDVGIFTWNSDLEGMIFGYGDPAHCEQIIRSMPKSMKEFCMEQSSTLSGSAFSMFSGSSCPVLSRPSIRDNNNIVGGSSISRDKKNSRSSDRSSITSSSSSTTFNDYDRVVYLIESSPGKELLSIDIPKYYQMSYGTKFRCMNGGVSLPFNVLVDKIKLNPNIKVTQLDFSAFPSPSKSTSSTPAPDILSFNPDDDDGGGNGIESEQQQQEQEQGEIEEEEEGDYDSQFAALSDVDTTPSDEDYDESESSVKDEAEELADIYASKGSNKKGGSLFNDAILKNGNKKKNKSNKGKDKDRNVGSGDREPRKEKKEHNTKSNYKKVLIADSTPARKSNTINTDVPTITPRGADNDEHPSKMYRFEWIGPKSSSISTSTSISTVSSTSVEPADHIFQNPDYWVFVGSMLHGAKDRGGIWKKLPWSVLKDVISSTKNAKIPDNNIGKYLTNDDLRRYGRQSGLVPLHIGLQDLVDWMDEMETRALLMNHGG